MAPPGQWTRFWAFPCRSWPMRGYTAMPPGPCPEISHPPDDIGGAPSRMSTISPTQGCWVVDNTLYARPGGTGATPGSSRLGGGGARLPGR